MKRALLLALGLGCGLALAKERVLPGAHFQDQIPMFATLTATHKALGETLVQSGRVYAIKNSWYYNSHQPAETVAAFYAQRLGGADTQRNASNNLVLTFHPPGARPLPGTGTTEWVEIEITDMSALNRVLKQNSRSPRTTVHISEYLSP